MIVAIAYAAAMLLFPIQATTQYTNPMLAGFTQSEIDWLARAVVGEVSVMGEQRKAAGSWIVHSALNRLPNPWFPNDLVQVIRQGYNGAMVWENETPPDWAYDVVESAIELRNITSGYDPSRGALFAFGGQDIIPCMEPAMLSLYRPGYVFSVHIYKDWPYSDECWAEYVGN